MITCRMGQLTSILVLLDYLPNRASLGLLDRLCLELSALGSHWKDCQSVHRPWSDMCEDLLQPEVSMAL